MHDFLLSADFFSNNLLNSLSVKLWTQIKPDVMSRLIRVQTVCKEQHAAEGYFGAKIKVAFRQYLLIGELKNKNLRVFDFYCCYGSRQSVMKKAKLENGHFRPNLTEKLL